MTNQMIIALYKAENNITCPIHTYTKWHELGYQVKKGEKSHHKICIWKGATKKVKTEEGETKEVQSSKVFQKVACFFTIEQVEPIPKKEGQQISLPLMLLDI